MLTLFLILCLGIPGTIASLRHHKKAQVIWGIAILFGGIAIWTGTPLWSSFWVAALVWALFWKD